MKATIKACTCKQCKSAKSRKRTGVRRFFKRLTSKKLRRAKDGEVVNFYWS